MGWLHKWLVCHESIISRLKPLRRLKGLAFTRDVYSYMVKGQLNLYTYDFETHNDAWELHHQSLREWSLTYAEAFPNLGFIHVGKVSFKINCFRNNIELKATEDARFFWLRIMFNYVERECLVLYNMGMTAR